MYRFDKITKAVACILAVGMLSACTSPSKVVAATSKTTAPLVTTHASSSVTSGIVSLRPDLKWQSVTGEEYDYAAGKKVDKANFPAYYKTFNAYEENAYEHQYTVVSKKGHNITIAYPFSDEYLNNNADSSLCADQAIARKISSRVIAEAEALADSELPKIRGAAQYKKIVYENINCYIDAVMNNIITFSLYRNIGFEPEDSFSNDLYSRTTMIFDLNTGDMVPLSSIFVDGCDYKSIIDEYIKKYIEENTYPDETELNSYYQGNSLTMLAPFKGIRGDQPFSITQNYLAIYLDFYNSEFLINGSSDFPIYIPLSDLSDNLAIFDRYDTDKSLYKADTKLYLADTTNNNTLFPTVVDFGDKTKYSYTANSVYLENVPAHVNAALEDFSRSIMMPLQGFKVMADADLKKGGDDVRFYEFTFSTSTLARFVTIFSNEVYYGFADESSNKYIQSTYCYNEKEGRSAVVSDFFKEGVDYIALIKEYFQKDEYLSQYSNVVDDFSTLFDTEIHPSGEAMPYDKFVFYPNPAGLSFTLKISDDGPFASTSSAADGSINGFLPFDRLGYENFTFFD